MQSTESSGCELTSIVKHLDFKLGPLEIGRKKKIMQRIMLRSKMLMIVSSHKRQNACMGNLCSAHEVQHRRGLSNASFAMPKVMAAGFY